MNSSRRLFLAAGVNGRLFAKTTYPSLRKMMNYQASRQHRFTTSKEPSMKTKKTAPPTKSSATKPHQNQKATTIKEKLDPSANEKTARGLDFGTGVVNRQDVAPLRKDPDERKEADGCNKKSHLKDNLMDFLVFNDEDFKDDNRDTEDFVQNLLLEIDNDLDEAENILKRSPRKRKMKTDKECLVSSPSPGKSPRRQTPNRRRMSSTPISSKKSSQPRLDGWLSKIDAPLTSTRSPRKKSVLQRSDVKGQVMDILTPDSTNVSPPKVSPNKPTKLYPVFTPPTSPHLNTTPTSRKKQSNVGKLKSPKVHVQERSPLTKSLKSKTDNLEQTTLDLGQKRYGAVTCATCGTVYTAAHPEDETDHARFHKKYLSSIKFPGWKQEEVLESFHDGRILVVTHESPYYAEKKVDEIRELVDRELGFMQANNIVSKDLCKTYLFITLDKKVGGCLIAEQISKGYRVIVDDHKPDGNDSQKAWCCEIESEPALCGISRIWVPMQCRRKRIASRMVDCMRKNFMFGTVLSPDDIAFSDPTPDGKVFATTYTGTPRFLVYKYH
ncbi:N-acetyltransferase ESCO1-like [Lytechinus pictus]|uniref:N-acetyltransferase ESCO1-like n=1 Tax=Lytechinus pictus TaxID=7653 RepID=UPI0030B9B9DE